MASPKKGIQQPSKSSNAPPIEKENNSHIVDPNSAKMGELPAADVVTHIKAKPGLKKTGIGNSELLQSVPHINKGKGEKYIEHKNINAHIRFGGDRPSDRLSGYGGVGIKQSNTIDIVAGRMGASPRIVNNKNEELYVENNFAIDSARIYISQRTDIDHNFNIRTGLTQPAINCSAVALKADSVRIIARDDIKIVTGVDYYNSKAKISGINYSVPHKICLIGDNKEELLQPMIKGDNLKAFLTELMDSINSLISTVQAFCIHQNEYNVLMANHTHIVGPPGEEGIPSFDGITRASQKTLNILSDVYSSIVTVTTNLETSKKTYFDVPNDSTANTSNILSNYNFCN